MPFPSQIMGTGQSPLSSQTICGSGATALVAVGSTQTDALQLSASWNTITSSSASTGVKLLTCEQGAHLGICNNSGQTITIYPKETSGVTINAAASSVTLATGKSMFIFAPSATTWATVTSA